MDAVWSPKTFKYDHIVRDKAGKALGRMVLRFEESYKEGDDIQVTILKVPCQFMTSILGSFIYIDGYRYRVPEKLPDFRVNQRDRDWVVSSFILPRA